MQIMTSLLVAIITAIITANLATSRFKRERVWEKQAESYSRILSGIESAIRYSSSYISYSYGQEVEQLDSSEGEKELSTLLRNRESKEVELKDLQTKNHFFLSKNTREILNSFHEGVNWEDWEDGVEVAQRDLDRLQELKEKIEAEAELSIEPSPSNIWKLYHLCFRWCDQRLEAPRKILEQKIESKQQ